MQTTNTCLLPNQPILVESQPRQCVMSQAGQTGISREAGDEERRKIRRRFFFLVYLNF